MAVTSNTYTVGGSGQAGPYSYGFPILADTDIAVSVNGEVKTVTTHYTVDSGNTRITFVSGQEPSTGDKVIVYRDTDEDPIKSVFASGSTLRSNELNDNFNQLLYIVQENDNQSMSTLGGVMQGNLGLGLKNNLYFEGGTDDAHETTLTVVDPTADRTITLPNVTGTVVTTGDTGTVTSAMINDATIVNGDIANTTITGGKLVNDTITATQIAANAVTASELADDAVDRAAIVNDAVDGTKLADDAINSEHITDGSVDLAHLSANSVDSSKIVDGSIVNADINSSAAIAHSKLANVTSGQILVGNGSNVPTAVAVSGDVTLSNAGAVTIATGAVEHAMLAGDAVDGDNIADDSVNSEHYVDGSIDHAHLSNDCIDGDNIQDDAVAAEHVASNAIVNDSVAAGAAIAHSKLANITDGQILVGNGSNVPSAVAVSGDVTIANTGAVTIANDAVEIGMIGCEQTTISDSDSHIPTSGAVVDYVASVIAPIGGLEVIDDDESFPNTIPAAGVVISITDAAGLQVNSSGVSTNGDALDNSTITINGFPSELRGGVGSNADPYVFGSGAGLMVVSTGSSHTYNYHQAMIREADFVQLSDDINDFNSRYRIHAGEPSSNNDDGDLVWDTNADKMKVYDGTASAWTEVTSTGDFKFLVAVDAGTTTAATFDGSDTSFDLKETTNSGSAASVSNINQLSVSLNGIIQKPNTGSYSASEEGFYLTDTDTIRFCTAPPTGSSCFIIQSGSAVSIPTPGDGTVSAAKIAAGAVIAAKIGTGAVETAKLAADAVDGTKLADNACDSEHYTDGSIDHVHLANDAVDGDNIADDAINSEHYVDASIDHAHLANDCVDGDNIQDDVINSEHIAAGAVDLEHMSSQSVDEDNLYIDNAGSNGQFLSKQSGGTGGLLWADATTDLASLSDATVSTSDPAGDSNPSATGHVWINKNSGECYVCTDATSGNNVWTNIGDGTGPKGNYSVDFMIAAGGGGGGSAYAGGGGGGGMRASYNNETSGGGGSSETAASLSRGTQYTITVGAGGAGGTWGSNGGDGDHGDDGGASSISGSGFTTLTSNGGGGGGGRNYGTPDNGNGRNGGCGGGGSDGNGGSHGSGGDGTAGQGYDGADGNTNYDGGGGGGAGQVGDTPGGNGDAGNGGNGQASSINGSSVTRCGGGGGAQRAMSSYVNPANGDGGSGGGGNGARSDGTNPVAGNGNEGGGGGGGGDHANQNGAAGGSGQVYLRMATANYSGTTTGSPTVTTSGSDTILRYNGTGTYTA